MHKKKFLMFQILKQTNYSLLNYMCKLTKVFYNQAILDPELSQYLLVYINFSIVIY